MSISKKITQTSRFSGHFFSLKLSNPLVYSSYIIFGQFEKIRNYFFGFFIPKTFKQKFESIFLQNIFLLNQFDGFTSGGVLPIRYPRADYHIVWCQLFCAFPTSHLSAPVKKMVFVVFISEENLSQAKKQEKLGSPLVTSSPVSNFASAKFFLDNVPTCQFVGMYL